MCVHGAHTAPSIILGTHSMNLHMLLWYSLESVAGMAGHLNRRCHYPAYHCMQQLFLLSEVAYETENVYIHTFLLKHGVIENYQVMYTIGFSKIV